MISSQVIHSAVFYNINVKIPGPMSGHDRGLQLQLNLSCA